MLDHSGKLTFLPPRLQYGWPSVASWHTTGTGVRAPAAKPRPRPPPRCRLPRRSPPAALSLRRQLYGPQILLQLNIAYYAPSIPLLLFQGFFDEALEVKFGVSKTILLRLVPGLAGYCAICAAFPFLPQHLWALLASVVALGACSGLAFSASYQ